MDEYKETNGDSSPIPEEQATAQMSVGAVFHHPAFESIFAIRLSGQW